MWVDSNGWNNTGSHPGNDGEGIVSQLHNGTAWQSWAATRNVHEKGNGEAGYIAPWGGRTIGMLTAWNRIPGFVGIVGPSNALDVAVIANEAKDVRIRFDGAVTQPPSGENTPPRDVRLIRRRDSVEILWTDTSVSEIGFRIDRRIDDGPWEAIAMRPPHIQGHALNPQSWRDYLAPRGRKLSYRVVAMDVADSDKAASQAAGFITMPVVSHPE